MKLVGEERLQMLAACEHWPIGCSQQLHQIEQLNMLFYTWKEARPQGKYSEFSIEQIGAVVGPFGHPHTREYTHTHK